MNIQEMTDRYYELRRLLEDEQDWSVMSEYLDLCQVLLHHFMEQNKDVLIRLKDR